MVTSRARGPGRTTAECRGVGIDIVLNKALYGAARLDQLTLRSIMDLLEASLVGCNNGCLSALQGFHNIGPQWLLPFSTAAGHLLLVVS
jgi:hypothetical protein